MSQENVERYRRSVHTWNREALDEWLEDITPQWECVLSGTFPGLAPIYRGREGALAWHTPCSTDARAPRLSCQG